MSGSKRVLIAGGGISGLTAALCLHRAGHQVQVFESVAEPRELGVGLNLLPHSVRILHDLGLADQLAAAAVHTSALRFCSENGVTIWEEPRGEAAGNPWPQYSIHRGRLQMVLLDAVKRTLGSEALFLGHHFSHYTEQSDHVEAHFTDRKSGRPRKSFTGDVLVGADGLHSVLRKLLVTGNDDLFYSGLVLWRGAVEAPAFLDGRTMIMAGHDQQKAVIYPIRGPQEFGGTVLTNWVAERPVDMDVAAADWNSETDPLVIAEMFKDWDFGWLNVGELIASTPVAYEFPMVDRHPLSQWSHGRVTLLGDAAHPMRPNGSNGAAQGILDAEALTGALSEHADPERALLAYDQQRVDPTGRLVLANRQAGPERVMQWVHDRCDGTCQGQHQCVPTSDLEREANAYKKLAGFDISQLQALAQQPQE